MPSRWDALEQPGLSKSDGDPEPSPAEGRRWRSAKISEAGADAVRPEQGLIAILTVWRSTEGNHSSMFHYTATLCAFRAARANVLRT